MLDDVTDFVCEELDSADCPPKIAMQISVALEEMFVNVAHYAYEDRKGDVEVSVDMTDGRLTISLSDTGIPFNPLAKEDPDVTLSAEERGIGGLGIFMVKKIMDDVSYSYEDGKNHFTMMKVI